MKNTCDFLCRKAMGWHIISACIVFSFCLVYGRAIATEALPETGLAVAPVPKMRGEVCGLLCLYAAAYQEGTRMSLEALMTPMYLTSEGSSIRQLKAAAESYGLYAEALENLTLAQVDTLRGSIILHVKSAPGSKSYNHFVLYLGATLDGYRVLDPPLPAKVLSPAQLTELWDGKALIVSRAPIQVSRVGLLFSAGLAPWLMVAALAAFVALSRFFPRRIRTGAFLWTRNLIGGRVLVLAGLPFVFASAYHGLMPQGLFQDTRLLGDIQKEHASGFISKVGRAEFERLVHENGATLVDARMPADFQRGHVSAALNIPITLTSNELRVRSQEIPKDKGIVVYCQSDSCPYAGRVAFRLLELGYSDVRIFPGGWREWSKTTPRS